MVTQNDFVVAKCISSYLFLSTMNNSNSDLIKTEKIGKWLIITISGDFTVKYLTRIRNFFNEAESKNELFIALYLSSTTYLDSSAITILINFHTRCIRRGGKFVLAGLNKAIEEEISIVGVDKIIPIVKNINDLP